MTNQLQLSTIKLKAIRQYEKNPRKNDSAVNQMASLIEKFGFRVPVLAKSNGDLIDGHLRVKAAAKIGLKEIPVIYCDDLSDEEIKALRLSVNRAAEFAEWDMELLQEELNELLDFGMDLDEIGFGDFEFGEDEEGDDDEEEGGTAGVPRNKPTKEEARVTLAERFGIPPFSVLNAREGWWQTRKRAWLALGIKSELGRGEGAHCAAPGGSPMVSGYDKDGNRLVGLENIGGRKARNGKRKAATFGQDLMRGEHEVGRSAKDKAKSGLLYGAGTHDPAFYAQKRAKEKELGKRLSTKEFLESYYVVPGARVEKTAIVKGNGWGNGGPARRDPAFYAKKRAWEKENGRRISTTEFREKHWDGAEEETVAHNGGDGDDGVVSGTSIFDPVLAELAYRWFCPEGGTIVDPFAGGSVRGVVASKLGYRYLGHELRAEQVEANRVQGEAICGECQHTPRWEIGDSRNIRQSFRRSQADMIFSCPPYADLEVYSDDPNDLSNMPYEEFLEAYRQIIAESVAMLKENRFACFVVGDVRDKKGNYRNFVGDTVEAFRAAGMHYYNEAILVTSAGSLPIRAGKQFSTTRKLGKTHQNILVFVKGDAKIATQECGEVEFGEMVESTDNPDNEHSDLGEQL